MERNPADKIYIYLTLNFSYNNERWSALDRLECLNINYSGLEGDIQVNLMYFSEPDETHVPPSGSLVHNGYPGEPEIPSVK
jgi:hypothetical protein